MGAHIYQTTGSLTGAIESDKVAAAQAYLTQDDMTQFVDERIKDSVVRVQWNLSGNGYDYVVEAITDRELTAEELETLSAWVSGQNSDGLGEGFEQQPFAEVVDSTWDDDADDVSMISFDWRTNDSKFVKVL